MRVDEKFAYFPINENLFKFTVEEGKKCGKIQTHNLEYHGTLEVEAAKLGKLRKFSKKKLWKNIFILLQYFTMILILINPISTKFSYKTHSLNYSLLLDFLSYIVTIYASSISDYFLSSISVPQGKIFSTFHFLVIFSCFDKCAIIETLQWP